MSLSHGQMIALELTPKIGALLSLLGSSFILGRFALHRTELSQRITHRILFGMSLADILNSIHFFASSWAAPAGSPDVLWAVGTQQTCSLQSFLGNFGIMLPIYNVGLSTFYYLTVVHSWRERDFVKVEWAIHLVPILFCLATGTAALFQKLYAYAGSWCWIAPDPPDCLESFYHGYTTCERGDNWSIYRWAYWYVPLWICLIIITVLQVLMYRSVRGIEQQAGRWDARVRIQREQSSIADSHPNRLLKPKQRSPPGEDSTSAEPPNTRINACTQLLQSDQNNTSNESVDESKTKPSNAASQQSTRRATMRQKSVTFRDSLRRTFQPSRNSRGQLTTSSQVYGQCLAYVLAAYGTFLFPTINRITTQVTGDWFFGLALLHAITEPTQGLWNYLVFNRPRYLKYRRTFPEHGRFRALYATFLTFGASTVTDAVSEIPLVSSLRQSSLRFSQRLRSRSTNSYGQDRLSLQILQEEEDAPTFSTDPHDLDGAKRTVSASLVVSHDSSCPKDGVPTAPPQTEEVDQSSEFIAIVSASDEGERQGSEETASITSNQTTSKVNVESQGQRSSQLISASEGSHSSLKATSEREPSNDSFQLENAIEGEIEFC